MNHRETPSLPTSVRRALHCISLLLLPTLTPEAAPALPRQRHAIGHGADGPGSDALPYLGYVGAPPLRFQRATLPPDVVTPPAAAAPPIPHLSSVESSVALANVDAARSATVTASVAAPATPLVPETKSDPKDVPAAPAKSVPRAILPDDTRPTIRPEDFLPYFQIPGANKQTSELNVIMPTSVLNAPAPAPLPPSSATYTQSPK